MPLRDDEEAKKAAAVSDGKSETGISSKRRDETSEETRGSGEEPHLLLTQAKTPDAL